MESLVPAPNIRVAEATDGLVLWLSIPHTLRSLSFLLEPSGTLWCAIWLNRQGNARDECWLSELDCATGAISYHRLPASYTRPLLRRDPSGSPFVVAQELPTLGSAAFHPVTDPAAVRRAALPKGEKLVRALGNDGPLSWVISTKTFKTTQLSVDRSAGGSEPSVFAIPRGLELIDAIPTANGYAVLGAQAGGLRRLQLDWDLATVTDERSAGDGVSPKALVRLAADGTLVALGQRGAELGRIDWSPGGGARFTPIVTLPYAELGLVTMSAPSVERDGAFTAAFSFHYAGQAKSGSGALRVDAEGGGSYVFTSAHDAPGTIEREHGSEPLFDQPLRLDFLGRTAALEVACFDRSWLPDRGYSAENRQLIRVWRH